MCHMRLSCVLKIEARNSASNASRRFLVFVVMPIAKEPLVLSDGTVVEVTTTTGGTGA